MSERLHGVVKWFDPTKGYGFIRTADCDVFLHATAVEGLIGGVVEGDCLSFTIGHRRGRPHAANVERADETPTIHA